MLDGTKIKWGDAIFQDQITERQVVRGDYSPVGPDGEKVKSIPAAIKCYPMAENSQSFLAGVMQTVAVTTKLESLESVCTCHGYFTQEKWFCLVMEYLPRNLSSEIARRAASSERYYEQELMELLRDIAFVLLEAKKKVRGK